MMILTIIVFIIILSVLVLIHEAGHFFVAKFFNIKVEEFGFGFPPRLFGIKKGETLYSINALPIGGFVKLYGEDDAGGGRIATSDKKQATSKDDLDRAFFSKNPWQRAAVTVAGVVMNALLAMVIFYIFLASSNFQTVLPNMGNYTFFGANQSNIQEGVVVDGVVKDSPADKVGIKAGVRILSLANKTITNTQNMLSIVAENKGKAVPIVWQDLQTKNKYSATITPRIKIPENQGALGIRFQYSPVSYTLISFVTPQQKFFSGITYTLNIMPWQLNIIGSLVSKSFQDKNAAPIADTISGPVGIGLAVGSILEIPDPKTAILQLLNLAGIMSAALAFFNVLPIPALDGGRLFFVLIEAVTGKRVPAKIEGNIHAAGMIVLLGLMALITFHDLSRVFSGLFLHR